MTRKQRESPLEQMVESTFRLTHGSPSRHDDFVLQTTLMDGRFSSSAIEVRSA